MPLSERGNMPRERVRASGNNSHADVMVRWSKQGSAEAAFRQTVRGAEGILVDLFIAPRDTPNGAGFFSFTPDDPASIGLSPGESVGPITVDLDRAQINRLIRVLRDARDAAYGRDE